MFDSGVGTKSNHNEIAVRVLESHKVMKFLFSCDRTNYCVPLTIQSPQRGLTALTFVIKISVGAQSIDQQFERNSWGLGQEKGREDIVIEKYPTTNSTPTNLNQIYNSR